MIVTMAGVARRRRMQLQRIRVEITTSPLFEGVKSEAEEAAVEGRQIDRKEVYPRVIVKGNLSDRDMQVLKNTVKYCPVSRLFANGAMQFYPEFVVED